MKAIDVDLARFHGVIRDDLAAHRDDLGLDVIVDVWNEIDSDTLEWFVTEAEETMKDLLARHPLITGAVQPFDAENDAALGRRLMSCGNAADEFRVSSDALALTRGEATNIPVHEVQARVGVLLSVFDTLKVAFRVWSAAGDEPALRLLLKTMVVLDAVNALDGTYGAVAGASARRSDCLLVILERGAFDGAPLLRACAEELDLDAIRRVRDVRNRGCAHLDRGLTTRDVIELVAGLDHAVLADLVSDAWGAFERACAADRSTRWMLPGPAPQYVLGPASTPGVRPFDR